MAAQEEVFHVPEGNPVWFNHPAKVPFALDVEKLKQSWLSPSRQALLLSYVELFDTVRQRMEDSAVAFSEQEWGGGYLSATFVGEAISNWAFASAIMKTLRGIRPPGESIAQARLRSLTSIKGATIDALIPAWIADWWPERLFDIRRMRIVTVLQSQETPEELRLILVKIIRRAAAFIRARVFGHGLTLVDVRYLLVEGLTRDLANYITQSLFLDILALLKHDLRHFPYLRPDEYFRNVDAFLEPRYVRKMRDPDNPANKTVYYDYSRLGAFLFHHLVDQYHEALPVDIMQRMFPHMRLSRYGEWVFLAGEQPHLQRAMAQYAVLVL